MSAQRSIVLMNNMQISYKTLTKSPNRADKRTKYQYTTVAKLTKHTAKAKHFAH